MRPVIYIANSCHQCGIVKEFVRKSAVDTDIYNVDLQNVVPPMDVFAYPVLFIDSKLVAYGADIISYYENKLIN